MFHLTFEPSRPFCFTYLSLTFYASLDIQQAFLMLEPGEKYCHDLLQDKSPCKCELFTPPVEKNAAYCCQECGHGYSKHPHSTVKEEPDSEQRILDLVNLQQTQASWNNDLFESAVRNEVLGTYCPGHGTQCVPSKSTKVIRFTSLCVGCHFTYVTIF